MSSRAKHDLHLSFQDKILHIAKVAEAAKTENLNLSEPPHCHAINFDQISMSSSLSCSEDKLATDVGTQDTRIQNLANQVKQKSVQTWSDVSSNASQKFSRRCYWQKEWRRFAIWMCFNLVSAEGFVLLDFHQMVRCTLPRRRSIHQLGKLFWLKTTFHLVLENNNLTKIPWFLYPIHANP